MHLSTGSQVVVVRTVYEEHVRGITQWRLAIDTLYSFHAAAYERDSVVLIIKDEWEGFLYHLVKHVMFDHTYWVQPKAGGPFKWFTVPGLQHIPIECEAKALGQWKKRKRGLWRSRDGSENKLRLRVPHS